MPLALKQLMAKAAARKVVEKPDKFSPKAVAAAKYFLKCVDDYDRHPLKMWEEESDSWHGFRQEVPVEKWPALLEKK